MSDSADHTATHDAEEATKQLEENAEAIGAITNVSDPASNVPEQATAPVPTPVHPEQVPVPEPVSIPTPTPVSEVHVPKPAEQPIEKPVPVTSTSSVAPMAEQSTPKKPLSEALASLTFSPDKQKPLSQLHACDIPLWNNAYVSAAIFLTGQILYLLFTKFEFSVVTLIGRLILMQVVGFFLFVVGTKIIKNQNDSPVISKLENFDLSQYEHQVKTLLAILNDMLKYYVGILSLKSPQDTAKFAVAVQIVCWLGNKIDGLNLAYIALWVAFTIPKIYEVKQNEIDALLVLAYSKVLQAFAFLQSKIPKAADIPSDKKDN